MLLSHRGARDCHILKKEVIHQFVAAPFDGTTRLGEVVCQTVRWCDINFDLQQQLLIVLMVQTTKTHANASQLASVLTSILTSEMGIGALRVVVLPRVTVEPQCGSYSTYLEEPLLRCHRSYAYLPHPELHR